MFISFFLSNAGSGQMVEWYSLSNVMNYFRHVPGKKTSWMVCLENVLK